MLNVIEEIPRGLLDLPATELHTMLPGPTLLCLNGIRQQPVFVSVLVHGNEHTGWEAVRKLLAEYKAGELPRSMVLFIGNVEAARQNRRFLDGQPDFNRIWSGGTGPEHIMMQQVLEQSRSRNVLMSIDIHNNTGKNPHYACVNKTYNRFMQLATLFSSIIVYFIRPAGVQSMAFADICPAVTIECGQSGDAEGTDHVYRYLQSCLLLDELPDHAVDHDSYELFHTVAVVRIPADINFGFKEGMGDLELYNFIEKYNFTELPANTEIGKIYPGDRQPFTVQDERGIEVFNQYFAVKEGRIFSRQTLIPSMITLDTEIISKDCFCYLMERCTAG